MEGQGVRVHLKRVKQTTIRSSPFFAYDMSAEKSVEQSFTVWEQAPQSAFFLAYAFVTAVFEADTEHKADDIEE